MTVRRLVIATTLLICLMFATHAGAKTAPRSFYGVIPADDPTSTEIDRMGAGKVGTLRINFVWGAVQPTAGAPFDWSHYDAIIGQAAKNGIRVLPTVYSSPAWAAAKTPGPLHAFFVRIRAKRCQRRVPRSAPHSRHLQCDSRSHRLLESDHGKHRGLCGHSP